MAADQSSITSTSRLLQGASNFRDLGGLTTADGRQLKHGLLFRSDHLADLDEADQAQLRQLGVRCSVDFRGVQERQSTPYDIEGLQRVHLPIEPVVSRRLQQVVEQGQTPTAQQAQDWMCDTYRAFVLDQAPTFARFLRLVGESDGPLVFHCTAGKDRTGFAAAMLLSVLDVPEHAIEHDYLLTNALYRRPARAEAYPQEVMQVLWTVQPLFLQTAFAAIRKQGGLQAYLSTALGVDDALREQLQQRLLQG